MSTETESQSVSRSGPSSPESPTSRNHSHLSHQAEVQQIRPSVITCAPSLNNTRYLSNVSNLSHDFSKCLTNNRSNHEPYKKSLLREAILSNKSLSKEARSIMHDEDGFNSYSLLDNCDSVINEHLSLIHI